MTPEDWQKVFDDDDLGLLTTNTKRTPSTTEDERLICNFQEINEFVNQNGHPPALNSKDTKEFSLNKRNQSRLQQDSKAKKLRYLWSFSKNKSDMHA
jgi:hypothetical protein